MPGQLVRLTDQVSGETKQKLAQKSPAQSVPEAPSRKQPARVANKTAKKTEVPASRAKAVSSADKGRFDNGKIVWEWPVNGRLLKSFSVNSSNIHKGIDLGGSIGDAVRSAAKGQVVYSGNGLSGYGNLVIVKHNQMYLSAYAHNRRLLVKEGQWVDAGEKIAELGKSGADRAKLHFQIRRDGKPVNPLKLLPPKG
jgi:lipoprotein NlpD